MPRYTLDGVHPTVSDSAFIAPSADLIGRVTIAERASVWYGVVARGDIEPITVGAESNVQDGAVLHTDAGHPCTLHERVTVGHRAVVHGATCEAGSLVGMGAIMLSGSRLGRGAVLAAGALLKEGQHVPDGMLAVGVPARIVREIPTPDNAARYARNAANYRNQGLHDQEHP